ncbi:hypothetical protein MRB53_041266 [Persea americana]|nr:hypothetical protein MRB53_041266 [Persea americana]
MVRSSLSSLNRMPLHLRCASAALEESGQSRSSAAELLIQRYQDLAGTLALFQLLPGPLGDRSRMAAVPLDVVKKAHRWKLDKVASLQDRAGIEFRCQRRNGYASDADGWSSRALTVQFGVFGVAESLSEYLFDLETCV